MIRHVISTAAFALCAQSAIASVSTSLRPTARPADVVADTTPEPALIRSAFSASAVGYSYRPITRPSDLNRNVTPAASRRVQGQICGSRNIQGTVVAAIPGRISGCGIANPVKVRAVAGVPLSTEAIMDCTTAKAFATWVERGMKPAMGNYKGGVARINVVAHYACRTRNNQPGAKISEHGKGRAVDISGFKMNDGSTVTLLNDWNRSNIGNRLRKMHRAACGPFGTVLGPEANRFHLDHFHFDTARYRSGSYCR